MTVCYRQSHAFLAREPAHCCLLIVVSDRAINNAVALRRRRYLGQAIQPSRKLPHEVCGLSAPRFPNGAPLEVATLTMVISFIDVREVLNEK